MRKKRRERKSERGRSKQEIKRKGIARERRNRENGRENERGVRKRVRWR